MSTLTLKLDVANIKNRFAAKGCVDVSTEEIETVMAACLTQYIKDGWVTEVLVAELNQLRADPELYKKDAGLE